MKQKKIFVFLIIILIISYFALYKLGYLPSIKYIFDDFCFSSDCFKDGQTTVHKRLKENQLLNYETNLQELLEKETKIDKSKFSILIEKLRHRLTVYYKGKPLKSYPVVFGLSPIKDKLQEGDRRTPEGIFHIQDLYEHNSWSKFLWLDYPTKESWKKHLKAKLKGQVNLKATIGGQVGIHGVPDGKDELIDKQINWTWGCISLKTKDINEIYNFVQKGTLVEIVH